MLALLTYALSGVPLPPPPSASMGPEIVVIGQRVDDARARLEACLARHCAVHEEIDATLGLAEAQMVDGDYDEARETLQASMRRNKRAGDQYAVPLSDLYRANGRVAAHLGIDSDYYRSAYASYSAIKRGTKADDYRRFMAQIDIAEMLATTRGHQWARNYYEGIVRDARKAGREDIAAIAELRSVMRHLPDGELRTMAIERIAQSTDPDHRAAALEAKLALARVAFEKHDDAAADAIVRQLAELKIQKPILVYAPPIQLAQHELPNGSFFDVTLNGAEGGGMGVSKTVNLPTGRWSTINRLPEKVDDMWIDVGFRIAPDGTVQDAKILRSRGQLYWTGPLMASIRGRRYTPVAAGSAESYRRERYTYTAGLERKSETHMVGRSPKARIEFMDLAPKGLVAQN